MSSRPITDEEAVAAADKEMEERANRAKELLSQRYVGLKRQQVSTLNFQYILCFISKHNKSGIFYYQKITIFCWCIFFVLSLYNIKTIVVVVVVSLYRFLIYKLCYLFY